MALICERVRTGLTFFCIGVNDRTYNSKGMGAIERFEESRQITTKSIKLKIRLF